MPMLGDPNIESEAESESDGSDSDVESLLSNQDMDLDNHLEIRTREDIHVKKFMTTARGLELRFKNMDKVEDLGELLYRSIQTALDRTLENADSDDRIGVEMIVPELDSPIIVPFTTKDNITVENVLHLMEQVLQSNTEVKLDDGLIIRTVHVEIPKAGGKGNRAPFRSNLEEFLKQKGAGHGSSLIPIENSDNLCVPRAVVLGIARMEKDQSPEKSTLYDTVRKGDRKRHTKQKTLALELAALAGIDTSHLCGPEEFDLIQGAMPQQYRLIIYSGDQTLAKVYEGPSTHPTPIRLFIYHADKHAALITSMAQFSGTSYWCDTCEKGFDKKTDHKCYRRCRGCLSAPPCPKGEPTFCPDCHRMFDSKECFDNHKSTWSGVGPKRRRVTPICDVLKFCLECELVVAPDHKCGYTKCQICSEEYKKKDEHQCFMPTYTKSSAASKRLGTFIFFDMESIVDEEVVGHNDYGNISLHKPNCICSVKVCRDCVSNPELDCPSCGPSGVKMRRFFGGDVVKDFCQYLFSPQHKNMTALAHNLRSYDGVLLLKYLESQPADVQILNKGLSILSLEANGIRCVDTLNFIPMKLSEMGKAFGIPESKGHFPFYFNRHENYDAVLDQLPDISYFDPANRSPKDRDDLYRWCATENARLRATGEKWVFMDQLFKYCMSDTVLLAKAAFKFRNDMLDRTGVCPFTESVTIASACNIHFRKNHLTEGLIGLCPEGGYRRSHKQSMMALRYMKWISQKEEFCSKDKMIKHSLNGGEDKIAGFKVDGLVCRASTGEDLKEVYEIHGCAYHGCPTCFSRDRTKMTPGGISMDDALERTLLKQKAIEDAGYKVITIWEHKIREDLKKDPLMKEAFDSFTEIQDPLDPREAFYGGRVGALEMYRKVGPGQRIDYVDVISLYPFVNRYCAYPIGHPVVTTENFLPVSKTQHPYEGLMKITILPPRQLLHPVLPYRRSDGRLIFGLCRSCIDLEQKETCDHSVEERALTGVWVTVEIYKALDMGYELLEIFEVYHYDAMKEFDGEDPKTGLFSSYIGWAVKLKLEASGYPNHVKTDAQKRQFVADYYQHEGIQLDAHKIEHNPSLRSLGKLTANSFWGKLGQSSKKQTSQRYCTNMDDVNKLMLDPTVEVLTHRFCSGFKKVCITYRSQEEFRENPHYVSVAHAVYTVAYARLVLYSYLEKLGDRVLYYDTDSCIFLSGTSPDEYQPGIGSFLGDMSSELDEFGSGSYCTQFVAGGPKAYAMKIYSTKMEKSIYKVKIKGVTQTSIAIKQINFKTLRKCVLRYLKTLENPDLPQATLSTVTPRIRRDKSRNVTSCFEHKTFTANNDKVIVFPSGKSLPYGY